MGREAKLLLALLGLLAGALVGVVSMKLLVPRPPVGAGPDIHHGDLTASEVQELVEPPALSLPAGSDTGMAPVAALPESRFAAARPEPEPPMGSSVPSMTTPVRDPFVAPASFAASSPEFTAPTDDLLPPPADMASPAAMLSPPAEETIPPRPDRLPAAQAFEPQPAVLAPPATRPTRFSPAGPPPGVASLAETAADMAEHVAQPGDSWWLLAEQTYGDGRLYRALFAWNRRRDPRISLVPGTRLDLPPLDRLAAAWPALMPRE
jgi:nucleoid-associated protein YgaU